MTAAGRADAGDTPNVSVLVVPGLSDGAGQELAELLGQERFDRLRGLLLSRAVEWARRLTVSAPHIVGPESLTAMAERLWADGPRPLLIAWADLPVWRSEHAAAALDDLAAGCDVSVGPVFDGGFYLLALARPIPALLQPPAGGWAGADAMAAILTTAHEGGLFPGLLRPERGLRRAADVGAALADPLLDAELAAILRRT